MLIKFLVSITESNKILHATNPPFSFFRPLHRIVATAALFSCDPILSFDIEIADVCCLLYLKPQEEKEEKTQLVKLHTRRWSQCAMGVTCPLYYTAATREDWSTHHHVFALPMSLLGSENKAETAAPPTRSQDHNNNAEQRRRRKKIHHK